MKISIVGTGYVGLVTGTCLAETGNHVFCIDVDHKKIQVLTHGKSPIYEPGLESLIQKNIASKRIQFGTSLEHAVRSSEIIFLCLPTPPNKEGRAELRHIFSVTRQIAKFSTEPKLIVTKSTVPVGTADAIRKIFRKTSKIEISVASNPEFLKEGSAVQEFMFPDRVVIGVDDPKSETILTKLYEPYVRTGAPILVMDTRSAEMAKHAANAFLASKVSFINEVANLCERVGADIDRVRMAMGHDARIGPKFLFPGIGWGGSCLPKDTRALIKIGEDNGVVMSLVASANKVNEGQKLLLVRKVQKHFRRNVGDLTLGLWGLSFKPKTDDMRDAPSVPIVKKLLDAGARIIAFDPIAMPNAKKVFGKRIQYAKTEYAALRNVDALLVVTEWNEFRRPDFEKMKSLMKRPVIFDGRNIYDPKEMKEKGFTYYGIGRRVE